MQKRIQTVDESESVKDAIEKMNFFRISCIIVNNKGSATGILTERDLINRVLLKNKNIKKTKIKDVMTSPIISKTPNTSIYKIIKSMNEFIIRHVPIMKEDKVIGIVTQTDMLKFTEKSFNIKFMISYLTIIVLLFLLIFMR